MWSLHSSLSHARARYSNFSFVHLFFYHFVHGLITKRLWWRHNNSFSCLVFCPFHCRVKNLGNPVLAYSVHFAMTSLFYFEVPIISINATETILQLYIAAAPIPRELLESDEAPALLAEICPLLGSRHLVLVLAPPRTSPTRQALFVTTVAAHHILLSRLLHSHAAKEGEPFPHFSLPLSVVTQLLRIFEPPARSQSVYRAPTHVCPSPIF